MKKFWVLPVAGMAYAASGVLFVFDLLFDFYLEPWAYLCLAIFHFASILTTLLCEDACADISWKIRALTILGFGMEIHPPYCAVTLQRLQDMGLTPCLE